MCKDSIIEKIKKLLNKTTENGCTEEEALASFEMARKLMLKHKLEESELSGEPIKEIIKLQMTLNFSIGWLRIVIDILSKNFGVLLYTNKYKNDRKKYMVLFGEKENVECVNSLCNAIYEFANKKANKYGNAYRQTTGRSSIEVRNSYLVGFVKGLEAKYKEQNDNNNKFALVLIPSEEVKDEFKKLTSNFKTIERRTSFKYMQNDDAINQGFKDGKSFGTTAIEQ